MDTITRIRLRSFLLFLTIGFLISCENKNPQSTAVKLALAKSERVLKTHPDSTLILTNSFLKTSSIKALDDQEQLALYQLRARAFGSLKLIDSVCETGQKIRAVASRIPDSLAIAETLFHLYGNVDYKYLKEAKTYIPGAIATFKKLDKDYEKGILIELYGNIMNEEGEFKKSQNYYLEALKIFESKDSLKAMGRTYNELGINFACLKIINKSNFYYLKALKIAEIMKDDNERGFILLNIGINYKKSNPATAISFYNKALDLIPKQNSEMDRMRIQYNIANIYFDHNNFVKAEEVYKKVLTLAKKTNFQDGEVMASIALGSVYEKQLKNELALGYLKKVLKILEDTNQKNRILDVLPHLVSASENSGDFKMAYYYSNQLNKLKDDLLSIEKTKSILELEKKYQTQKKDLEITNLEKLSSLRYKIIFLLLIALLVVFYLWRQRNRLFHENKNAYAILMKKYKEENEARNKKSNLTLTPKNEVVPVDLDDVNALLYQKLLLYYENKKPYLDPKLKAEFIAKELEVSQRDITVVIKANGFSSFANFNNWFRVEEVKKCFDDIRFASIKTVVIATQSGFGSKQPFYNAFEEFTGLNPGFYREGIAKS